MELDLFYCQFIEKTQFCIAPKDVPSEDSIRFARKDFRKIYIEISNVCNLKCSFCPQSSLARSAEFMAEDFFHDLVKQVSPIFLLLIILTVY